jgi:hypothetical protein
MVAKDEEGEEAGCLRRGGVLKRREEPERGVSSCAERMGGRRDVDKNVWMKESSVALSLVHLKKLQ